MNRRLVGGIVSAVGKPPAAQPAPGSLLTAAGQLAPRLGLGAAVILSEDGWMRHIDVGLHGEYAGEGLVTQLAGVLVVFLFLKKKDKIAFLVFSVRRKYQLEFLVNVNFL